LETGEEITVTSDDELAELAVDCTTGGSGGPNEPTDWNDDCLEDATFSLIINDEVIGEMGEDDDIEAIIQEYIDNNPNTSIIIELGFPMTLTFESGDVVTVNDDEEFMNAMLEFCP